MIQFIDFTNNALDADQPGYFTEFENALNGGMAANNDSGSGYFVKNGSTWELAGLAHAIAFHSGQGEDSDTSQTSLFGNATFYSDLSVYAEQINGITGVPEPTTAIMLGAGLLVLGRKRR